MYGEAEWNGRRFMLVDTGGLEVDPRDPIEARVQDQARIAIAEADVIVFVVEAITGLTPADEEAAELLRRAKAPVLVAVNKSDNAKRELEAAEFYALGWEQHLPDRRDPRPRRRGPARRGRAGAAAGVGRGARAQAARGRGRRVLREVEAGRLEPLVVGEGADAARTARR